MNGGVNNQNGKILTDDGRSAHNLKMETETIKPDGGTLDIENVGFHGRSPSPRQRGEK